MKKIRVFFSGWNLLRAIMLLLLFLSFIEDGQAEIIFSDNFSGTTINNTKWNTVVNAGTIGQFTVNNGLYYQASTAAAQEGLISVPLFSNNIEAQMSFEGFSSTTSFNNNPPGPLPTSGLGFLMGSPEDFVGVGILMTPSGENLLAFNSYLAGSEWVGIEPMVLIPTTTSSGQFMMSYVGSQVDTFYDVGNGWVHFGSFHPNWNGPVPISLWGADNPNGATAFKMNSVTVATTPLPPALLVLAPGLAVIAAARRRHGK